MSNEQTFVRPMLQTCAIRRSRIGLIYIYPNIEDTHTFVRIGIMGEVEFHIHGMYVHNKEYQLNRRPYGDWTIEQCDNLLQELKELIACRT